MNRQSKITLLVHAADGEEFAVAIEPAELGWLTGKAYVDSHTIPPDEMLITLQQKLHVACSVFYGRQKPLVEKMSKKNKLLGAAYYSAVQSKQT